MMGKTEGRVTFQKVSHLEAPSIEAASRIDLRFFVKQEKLSLNTAEPKNENDLRKHPGLC